MTAIVVVNRSVRAVHKASSAHVTSPGLSSTRQSARGRLLVLAARSAYHAPPPEGGGIIH